MGTIKLFLLPPASLFVLAALGALMVGLRVRPRLGRGLMALALGLGYALATPYVAGHALRSLEGAPLAVGEAETAHAIVVLSGDYIHHAPPYGGPTLGSLSLERLRYGAHLARRHALPILVSGGLMPEMTTSLAALMDTALREDFGLRARWREARSRNTYENARMSVAMLRADGIERVLVVTHGWHMARAMGVFRAAGVGAIAAPASLTPAPEWGLAAFVPSSRALRDSALAVHEWLGAFWYVLRY